MHAEMVESLYHCEDKRSDSLCLHAQSRVPRASSLDIATWSVSVDRTPDGCWYVRPQVELGPYASTLTERLDYWADRAPERVFLAERGANGEWQRVSYRAFRERARNVAQWMLARRLTPDRPIAILSGNDVEHAVLTMAAMYAGIPCAPISPAYSLVASDLTRLAHIFDRLSPSLVFAADGAAFGHAIDAVVPRYGGTRGLPECAGRSRGDSVCGIGSDTGDLRGRRCTVRHRPRYGGEDFVYLRLHRHPEGRDHHPAHAVQQPANAAVGFPLLRRRAAGDLRLAAMAPHVRWQPQCRAGAVQRRYALHRSR